MASIPSSAKDSRPSSLHIRDHAPPHEFFRSRRSLEEPLKLTYRGRAAHVDLCTVTDVTAVVAHEQRVVRDPRVDKPEVGCEHRNEVIEAALDEPLPGAGRVTALDLELATIGSDAIVRLILTPAWVIVVLELPDYVVVIPGVQSGSGRERPAVRGAVLPVDRAYLHELPLVFQVVPASVVELDRRSERPVVVP